MCDETALFQAAPARQTRHEQSIGIFNPLSAGRAGHVADYAFAGE
jgi:hypothetical protein